MDKTESFEEFKNKNLHLFSLRKIKSEAFEFIWDYLTEKHNKEIELLKVRVKDKEIIQKERDDLLVKFKRAEKEIQSLESKLELLTKCDSPAWCKTCEYQCTGCMNKKLIENSKND